jgi:signal transduction histidine kinase/ligand-binding sensor domain-containing protein
MLAIVHCQAQLRFTHLQVKDGLSHSGSNCVIKDNEGYYWIGTQYGLNKYDGKHITQHTTLNTPNLSDNFILSAQKDTWGNIWWGTLNFLTKYNTTTHTFTTVKLIDTSAIVIDRLQICNNGNLLCMANGKIYVITRNQQQQAIPQSQLIQLRDLTTISGFDVANDTLYVNAVKNNVIHCYKLNASYNKPLLAVDSIVSTLTIPIQLKVLGANKFIVSKDKWCTYPSLQPVFLQASKEAGIISSNVDANHYYIGTHNGLYVYNKQFILQEICCQRQGDAFSLADNKIYNISNTHDGLIWCSNTIAGVNIYDSYNHVFNHIQPPNVTNYNTLTCYITPRNTLLVSHSNGWDEFKLLHNTWTLQATHSFTLAKITGIGSIGNTVYLATTKGFYTYANAAYELLPNTKDIYFYGLTVFDTNKLLLASVAGAILFSSSSNKLTTVFPHYCISCNKTTNNTWLVNTDDGTLVLDTNFKILRHIATELPTSDNNRSKLIIKTIPITTTNYWLASINHGLYHLNNTQLTVYNQSNGLNHNALSSMEQDTKGNVWVASSKGINCISKKNTITSYNQQLELPATEFMLNGSCASGNNLFFCSNTGLITFNANDVSKAFAQPEQLHLNLNYCIKNYTDTLAATNNTITLKATDKAIRLNFTVPSHRYYSDVTLKYQLQGFDTAWRTIANGEDINFTNLAYGTYLLQVHAVLRQPLWQQTYKLTIIVKAPFYKTAWFWWLCCVISAIVLGLSVWYASRLRYQQKLVVQTQLYTEKERISADLHDNIGSHLSHLINAMEYEQIVQPNNQLEILTSNAHDILNELRQTIWVLTIKNVSAIELDLKLKNYLYQLSTQYTYLAFNYNSKPISQRLLHDAPAIAIYRMAQEAINNAIKHSKASTITYSYTESPTQLCITIADNGVGFDTTLHKEGHYGINNLRTRAEQHNITLAITSNAHNGTIVQMTYNFKPDDNPSNS